MNKKRGRGFGKQERKRRRDKNGWTTMKKKATNGLETRHGKIPLLLSRSVSRDVAVLRARDGAIYSMQHNKNPSQVHSLYTANGFLSSSTRLFTSTRLFIFFPSSSASSFLFCFDCIFGCCCWPTEIPTRPKTFAQRWQHVIVTSLRPRFWPNNNNNLIPSSKCVDIFVELKESAGQNT